MHRRAAGDSLRSDVPTAAAPQRVFNQGREINPRPHLRHFLFLLHCCLRHVFDLCKCGLKGQFYFEMFCINELAIASTGGLFCITKSDPVFNTYTTSLRLKTCK